MTTFIEEDCTITHEGKSFTAGGAWICDCSDGYRRGVVYAKPDISTRDDRKYRLPIQACKGIVTDWHGNKIADAWFGQGYFGSFGARMRSVRFTIDGVTYVGRYGCDNADAVRVRSTKRVA